MFARHVTLGRAVIVIAGLLVFLALVSQFWASGAPTAYWAGVLAGVILAFVAAVVIGRTTGGWLAVRLGRERDEGRRFGVLVACFVIWVALNVYDRLTGG